MALSEDLTRDYVYLIDSLNKKDMEGVVDNLLKISELVSRKDFNYDTNAKRVWATIRRVLWNELKNRLSGEEAYKISLAVYQKASNIKALEFSKELAELAKKKSYAKADSLASRVGFKLEAYKGKRKKSWKEILKEQGLWEYYLEALSLYSKGNYERALKKFDEIYDRVSKIRNEREKEVVEEHLKTIRGRLYAIVGKKDELYASVSQTQKTPKSVRVSKPKRVMARVSPTKTAEEEGPKLEFKKAGESYAFGKEFVRGIRINPKFKKEFAELFSVLNKPAFIPGDRSPLDYLRKVLEGGEIVAIKKTMASELFYLPRGYAVYYRKGDSYYVLHILAKEEEPLGPGEKFEVYDVRYTKYYVQLSEPRELTEQELASLGIKEAEGKKEVAKI